MGGKVTVNHSNSLAVKQPKLLPQKSKSRNCSHLRLYRITIFCVLTCCIFVIYWIILTPLLLNVFTDHKSKDKWSVGLFVLYWLIAFLVWLFIMLCLILIWRCTSSEHDSNEKLQSYGTNGSISGSLTSTKFNHSQIVKLKDMKQDGSLDHLIYDKPKTVHDKPSTDISDEFQRSKIKKHRDLPPLVIHRRNSGNDIERVGTVHVEENFDENDEEKDELKSEYNQKYERESMKEYLKLVTVTPQDELDPKSAKGPLSPRELFFIDLIREAEKAEQQKASNSKGTEGKHFFPNDFSPPKKNIDDVSNDEKGSEMPTNKEQEATYFIAVVESPKSEKAEVYLEIDPDQETRKEWSVNLRDEKPVLMLPNNTKNEENDSASERVVLFEI